MELKQGYNLDPIFLFKFYSHLGAGSRDLYTMFFFITSTKIDQIGILLILFTSGVISFSPRDGRSRCVAEQIMTDPSNQHYYMHGVKKGSTPNDSLGSFQTAQEGNVRVFKISLGRLNLCSTSSAV